MYIYMMLFHLASIESLTSALLRLSKKLQRHTTGVPTSFVDNRSIAGGCDKIQLLRIDPVARDRLTGVYKREGTPHSSLVSLPLLPKISPRTSFS